MAAVTDLRAWALFALPGDVTVYHAGNLLADRESDPALGALASTAPLLVTEGRVLLTQRRVSEGVIDYLAVAASPGARAVEKSQRSRAEAGHVQDHVSRRPTTPPDPGEIGYARAARQDTCLPDLGYWPRS